MKRSSLLLLLLLLGTVGSSGCPAIALTLLGVGAGVGTGTGVSYTLDSIAYKTFTAPEEGLRAATLKTLKRMDKPFAEIRLADVTAITLLFNDAEKWLGQALKKLKLPG